MIVLGLAIGMITPPVAINLYVASTISGESIEKISRSVVPFLAALLLVYLAVVYLPLLLKIII
jgi:C4-dicarboxylate transporter DctM subunit